MDELEIKKRSRKFQIAVGVLCFSAFSLAVGWITGQEWVFVSGLVLGLYGAANVAGKYVK